MRTPRSPGMAQVTNDEAKGLTPETTKLARNSSLQVEYIGICASGVQDSQYLHFINKVIYDTTLSVQDIFVASNHIIIPAVTTTTVVIGSEVILDITGFDFTEVQVGDTVRVTTSPNNYTGLVLQIPTTETLVLNALTGTFVNESNALNATILVTLNNWNTRGYVNRRWDRRENYFYE